jgi:6-phosphofructokinase 1
MVAGLSHITLSVGSAKEAENILQFYLAIGFAIFRSSSTDPKTLEAKTESEQQKWCLAYFGLVSTIKRSKTEFIPTFVNIEICKTNLNHAPLAISPQDLIHSPVKVYIVTPSIEEIELHCKRGSHVTAHHPHDKDTFFVSDPLGNCLAFTTRSEDAISVQSVLDKTREMRTCMPSSIEPTGTTAPDAAFLWGKESLKDYVSGRKKRIGVLTSGGDSQGMNAAVRSVVRMAHMCQMEPFAIYDGYQGLVDNNMKIMGWADVQGLLRLGGTIIGTARCAEFRNREGRLQSAWNLVKNGIDSLVVIGGDGSLTGADMLRKEWGTLLDELLSLNRITSVERATFSHLNIVGLVGSIDNDMSSTDMTIGCASALHRICEAVDAIESTALSHGRAFVVEVMGRHCGWLALMAALATGADWLFVPERPPLVDDWEGAMCEHLKKLHNSGQKKIIVIVSEGAIDKNLQPITSEQVRKVLAQRIHLDARVTTLGHVQRGGSPAFYDRYLGTIQGVRAVEEILRATPETPSPMIGISQNKITVQPLVKAVALTHEVAKAIDAREFGRAMELRDPEFAPLYDTFVAMNRLPLNVCGGGALASGEYSQSRSSQKGLRIGILHIGAPSGGSNAATRAAVLLAINRGHVPIGIMNGVEGLIRGDMKELKRSTVLNWTARGGSELGTNRVQPGANLGSCAYYLQEFGIQALLLIGGFEAFTVLHSLTSARANYPAFCIPMAHIPATISNNVPGTEYSLGSDTALNAIVDACDKIKQSASASRKRVFVMEVHGGNVGYLATLGGLAGGATAVYIPEEEVNLSRIAKDVDHLKRRYTAEGMSTKEGRVLLRNQSVSETYSTEVLAAILRSEGEGLFDARTAILGHLQQGGAPSPLDRIRATRLAAFCVDWIERRTHWTPHDGTSQMQSARDPHSACVLGIRGADIVFTPVTDLMEGETEVDMRRSKSAWWMEYRPLIPMLSGYTMDPSAAATALNSSVANLNL